MVDLDFPVGIYKFHEDGNFNFQFNRTVAHGGKLDEVRAIAAQVTDIKSYIALMGQAEKRAKAAGERKAALAYLRAAEFFTTAEDGKADRYEEFKKLFYELNADMIRDYKVQRAEVPYENGHLPVLYSVHANPKGVVVLHGGYDSYFEEHLKIALHMYRNGYSVYIFEGPGQGECIYRQGIPFTAEWHKPVGAILDYFHLDDVAIMGISLGSILCRLAAAKERRIKYVCSVGLQTDLYESTLARMPKEFREPIGRLMDLGDKDEVNKLLAQLMAKSPIYSWYLNQGLHVFAVETPYDYMLATRQYRIAPVSDQITQDFLLVIGQDDHFLSINLCLAEIERMASARSFTLRIITPAEKGQNHCNIGNRKLMIDVFLNWLDETRREHQTAAAEGWL
jgi:alpha-beta hydrolase superfamily lysophospholipase